MFSYSKRNLAKKYFKYQIGRYPKTNKEIVYAVDKSSEFEDYEKLWLANNLPYKRYYNEEEIMEALGW